MVRNDSPLAALAREHEAVPDRVDVELPARAHVLVRGDRLLVVEHRRARVAPERDRRAPRRAALRLRRAADQHRVVEVGRVVERQRDLVRGAGRARSSPTDRSRAHTAGCPAHWRELRQLRRGQRRVALAAVRRHATCPARARRRSRSGPAGRRRSGSGRRRRPRSSGRRRSTARPPSRRTPRRSGAACCRPAGNGLAPLAGVRRSTAASPALATPSVEDRRRGPGGEHSSSHVLPPPVVDAVSYVTTHERPKGQPVSQSTTMVRKAGSLAPCRRAPELAQLAQVGDRLGGDPLARQQRRDARRVAGDRLGRDAADGVVDRDHLRARRGTPRAAARRPR